MKRKWSDSSVLQLIEKYSPKYGDNPIDIVRGVSRDMVLQAYTRGWSGPPYDMVDLAKLMGISISPNDDVLDGRIIPQAKEKFAIEYNPHQNSSRINFSIAHEIGHTFFPDCAEKTRYRYKKEEIEIENNWELEFLCNVAASELLLPYAEFSREVNSSPLNLNTTKQLASKYKASMESVFLRYTEVIDKPCAIAIASYGMDGSLKVEYSKSSTSSNLILKRNTKIPLSSVAYNCIRPGTDGYTDSQHWETYNNEDYSVFAIGLGSLKNSTGLRVGMFLIPKGMADLPDNLITTIHGDATSPTVEGNKIILQVVNSSAAVGSGFGKAISNKYPDTKKALCEWKNDRKTFRLGEINMVRVTNDTWVCQMFAQQGLRATKKEIPLKYWALRECLIELFHEAKDLKASVHMPAIGAGQAGGDWKVIEGMVHGELISKGIPATVYFLNGKMPIPEKEATLSLFD